MLTRKRKLSADTRGKKLLCRKRKYRKITREFKEIQSGIQSNHERVSGKFLSCSCWRRKNSKKITISELVERAGVSRAAFYRNYSSKEQILEEIFKNTVRGITDKLEEFNFKTEMYQIWLFLF